MNALERVMAETRTPGRRPTAEAWRAMSEEERLAWGERHMTLAEWEEAETHYRRALIQLLFFFQFFGAMTLQMASKVLWLTEPTPVGGVEFRTMATDGRVLYVWPFFALYHNDKQLVGVLLHELFHNIFFHPIRGLGYDPLLRNQAMDYAINLTVNDSALASQHLGGPMRPDLYDRLPWHIPVDSGYCVDEQYRDDQGNPMLWEEIYERLKQGLSPEAKAKLERGEGLERGDLGQGAGEGRLVDDHGPWQPGKRPADEEGNVNRARFDPDGPRRWATEANAQQQGQQPGYLPAGMMRRIMEWLYPPLRWEQLLQAYLKPTTGDFSWAPGDIRFPEPMPFFAEKFEITWITFGFDLSGSMSDEEITGAVENARSMIRGFPAMKGRAYFWDADVHQRCDLEEFEGQIERGIAGGGGTSIAPQFAAVAAEGLNDRTAVHVCFTDGYVRWEDVDPDQLPYDVLWVITNDHETPPEHPRYRYTRMLKEGSR